MSRRVQERALYVQEILQLGSFLADALITGIAAWLLARASGHGAHGLLEAALAWAWSFLALVAASGILLGATGGFGPTGFLLSHVAAAGLLALVRRAHLRADAAAAAQYVRSARAFLNQASVEQAIVLALGAVLAALTMLAAAVQPAVADTLTYHLPRTTQWLQDGRIQFLETQDPRLNFVAALPEVVTAWFLSATTHGYRLSVLPQAIAGIMAVGATIGLARQTGLSRTGALLAGTLLLGMGNVAAQFTAAQTDLFTTGLLAAAFFLWVAALRRGEVSAPGVLGAGFALGAKGTLFYLAPGAVLWVLWLGWRHPLRPRQWLQTALLAAVGILLFAGPGFYRNWRAYGDPLGPKEWVSKHHRGFDSWDGLLTKLRLNLLSSLAQNTDPHSQPAGLRDVTPSLGHQIVSTFPIRDDYTLDAMDRRGVLRDSVLNRVLPDADVASFGSVALLLFAAGVVTAALRRTPASPLVLVWSAGIVVFLLFFHGMHQWHPFAFRYLLLGAPWIALVGASALEHLRGGLRATAWTLLAVASASVAWHVTTRTHQAGWRALVEPERSFTYFLHDKWRQWSQQLSPADTLRIDLPYERPLSAFYRQNPPRPVHLTGASTSSFATAEAAVAEHPGWLITQAAQFLGREGRVAAETWLLAGDESQPGSVAAFRALRPGEPPRPILYRRIRRVTAAEISFDVLVRTWEPVVHFELSNPEPTAWSFEVTSPSGRTRGEVPGRGSLPLEITLAAPGVAQLSFTFVRRTEGPAGAGPWIELAGPTRSSD